MSKPIPFIHISDAGEFSVTPEAMDKLHDH